MKDGVLFGSKYLYIDWGGYRGSRRRWKFRHNRRVHNVYVQIGLLEVTVWYR